MAFLDGLLTKLGLSQGAQAELGLQALPVDINAVPDVQLKRALGRLKNLYAVEDQTQEVLDSIDLYKRATLRFIPRAPNSVTEVEVLLAEMEI